MRLPTERQAVDWAMDQARMLPDSPSDLRKRLLVLLHIIKQQEARIRELEDEIHRDVSQKDVDPNGLALLSG